MDHSNPILKETKKPIQSGIYRHLITNHYCIGEVFIVKDCESFHDLGKIVSVKKELQYK